MATNPLKVVIFTSVPAQRVERIIARILRDAPDAQVVGVLYAKFARKNLKQRMTAWRKKIKRPIYWRYVLHRMSATVGKKVSAAGDSLIRFIHAAPKYPNGNPAYSRDDLAAYCQKNKVQFLLVDDIHSDAALQFVRSLDADLGLVFGTKILKPSLFEIPKQGSINIHKRKVPDYRGGGAVGLWELLDGQKEIGITVHRVVAKVDMGAVIRATVIPIEPFDDLESLALKADVGGSDLIVAAIRDFAKGSVKEIPQRGAGKLFRNPAPEDFLQFKRNLAARRESYGNPYRRPRWKLLLKSLGHVAQVAIRSRRYRRDANYPVMILFHHMVADRPHRFGVSTAYFLRQVNYLLRHYRVVSLSEAVDLIRNGEVKVPTVAITFDDGYADNFVNLRAVTEETGIKIGYFISTGHISTGKEFAHDISANERGFFPNTWEQIEYLKHSGYEIGSHTRHHADCVSTDVEFLRDEIEGSAQDIKERLGSTPHFSFPFGFPQNISEPATSIACSRYENVFSAYRGGNHCREPRRILRRGNFPHTVWELELQLQSALNKDLEEPAHLKQRLGEHEES
jgi:peptidoglycan/xylan/chitin deacetylase (PgdA/CDA1 family)/folate-dependent phosphoribosylglycinamide formyltransferase PurN